MMIEIIDSRPSLLIKKVSEVPEANNNTRYRDLFRQSQTLYKPIKAKRNIELVFDVMLKDEMQRLKDKAK